MLFLPYKAEYVDLADGFVVFFVLTSLKFVPYPSPTAKSRISTILSSVAFLKSSLAAGFLSSVS